MFAVIYDWFMIVILTLDGYIKLLWPLICNVDKMRKWSFDKNFTVALFQKASRKTKKKEGGAKRAQRASSNVFSMFEQTQIQEFKEVMVVWNYPGERYVMS